MRFPAFLWSTGRHAYRGAAGEVSLFLTLLLMPVVIIVLFTYLVCAGLEDLRAGWVIRWSATLLAAVVVLAACLEDRWLVGIGIAFGLGAAGLLMTQYASYRTHKALEESDESGTGYRFS